MVTDGHGYWYAYAHTACSTLCFMLETTSPAAAGRRRQVCGLQSLPIAHCQLPPTFYALYRLLRYGTAARARVIMARVPGSGMGAWSSVIWRKEVIVPFNEELKTEESPYT